MLLQKTFTADYLTKRRVKNSGQQKQYYVKNLTRKGKTARGVYSSKYALTGIMVCNECGAAGQSGQKVGRR
ncbi:hypothetical protein [Enterocloster bolteae]|uniref:hypothetical protein n=1 Tax=Enterocloster bolteae TaxID=208479 RepID=UPI001FF6F63D|nr:hypothetical protein [Enterocloster bolteae]UOX70374.1 hypothetical protein K4205_01610 [Enterocloster bolteae]